MARNVAQTAVRAARSLMTAWPPASPGTPTGVSALHARVRAPRLCAGILALFTLSAFAQPPQPLPAFDVASVKPNTEITDRLEINIGSIHHGEVKLGNANMNDCISFAYSLTSHEQISGPAWMASYATRFDIDAKAPPNTPRDQVLLMLQRLLAERFHLALHHDVKAIAHYEIEVGKGGSKLPVAENVPDSSLVAYGRGRLEYHHVPMEIFAVLLSRQLKQPVIDRTGLQGVFDVNLTWRPDDAPAARAPDAAPPPADREIELRPDLFRAMETQLGLKLIASKSPIDVLVIDHVDQTPVGN